jgi:hypothetical protein
MGLQSGGCSPTAVRSCGGVAVLESSFDGGGGVVVTGPLGGSGGGGGHMADPTSGESGPASLAPSLGARVLVGRPRGPIWIRAICLYGDLGGVDSGTEMTLTGSLSLSMTATTTTSSSSSSPTASSSSSSMTSSSPSHHPVMKTPIATTQPGMGTSLYHRRRMAVPGDPTGRRLDLMVSSAYRLLDRGKVKEAIQEP